MIKLESGQNCLWQWNTGQRLEVDYPVGTILDFTTGGSEAVRRDVYERDGALYADIPNALLQSAGKLYVYVHHIEGDQLTTVLEAIYSIRSQPKPPDYIDNEDEILIWHQLEEQVRADAAAAAGSVVAANLAADRAEQAAANSGYMVLDIDENGHLIYSRTESVNVNFYLQEGELMVDDQ